MINNEQFWTKTIVWVSVLIPIVVTILAYISPPKIDLGFDIHLLPRFHALLNATVTLLLLASFYFIKQKKIELHKRCNLSALVLSAIFLVSYITYHSLSEPTRYCGEGLMRTIYFLVLISHIVLAALVLPFILFTFLRALTANFEQHRRLAKWTFPIWLYVSITGVIVYFMIAPCYQ